MMRRVLAIIRLRLSFIVDNIVRRLDEWRVVEIVSGYD